MGINGNDIARQQLLEVAGEIFAEKGFRKTTIREICLRAHANVAAINYYFGSKEKLYTEVWRYSHHCALEKFPNDLGLAPSDPPEKNCTLSSVHFSSEFLNQDASPGLEN